MKRSKSNQPPNENRQSLLEARSKNKLRLLMKANEIGKNDFIEHHDEEEYVDYDKQDYNDLEKWKKDLELKESDDMSDKLKKRFQHIQALKDDISMPELNYDIVDSVMNPKYYQDFDEVNTNTENTMLDDEPTETYNTKTRNSQIINPEFKTLQRSSFSLQNSQGASQNFSDFILEGKDPMNPLQTKDKSGLSPILKKTEENTQIPSPRQTNQGKYSLCRIQSQSSVFLQRNLNKQLLNNLLLTRITKKYHQNKDTNTQEEEQGNKKRKVVTIDPSISGQSFYQQGNKQKNLSLDIVRHLFSEETEKFSKTTLNSFKNVGAQFFRLGHVIEYETLLKDIINTIYHPKGILQEKQIDGIKGGIEFDMESFNYLEKALLDNYHNCTKEIEEVQAKIKEERLFQTNITQELKNVHDQMGYQLSRMDAEEELFRNDVKSANTMQLLSHSSSTKMNANRFRNQINPDYKAKHQRIENEREEIRIYFEALKKVISQRIKTSLEKLEIMDKEILKIKQKRNTTKVILKDLYFKALKNDSHFSSQSLVWIIKSLININEDMTNTNIFPSILDDTSKQFLVSWAKLLIQQDKIQEKIKCVNTDNLNVTEQYQNLVLESSKISSQNSRDAIKQKVNRMAKNSSIYYRKPGDTQSMISTNQNFFPGYDEVNNSNLQKNQNQERIAFDLNKFTQECVQTVEMKNDMRQDFLHINDLIEDLKNEEKQRLCKKLKATGSGYQLKLQTLQQTLQALFGNQEGEAYLHHHLKEMSNFDEKINNQKFFKFTSKKSMQEQQNYNNEDNFNQTKLSFLSTTVNTPSAKQPLVKPEETKSMSQDRRPSQQKLSLQKDVIENFNEKKKSIIQNHQITLQYNQLSNYFFANTTNKNINKNNSNQPMLEKYFFNINVKQRQSSEHNYPTNTTTSSLKSPQFAQTSTNFTSNNIFGKKMHQHHPTYFY